MKKSPNVQITKNIENKAMKLPKKFVLISFVSVCIFSTSIAFANKVDNESNDEIVRLLSEGNLSQIEQVFDNGLDVNHDIGGDGTPLIIAVQNRNKALVKYLLDQGADVNRESIRDGNPLIAAALTNNVDLAKYLYQHGAKIDAVVEHDETALISASRAGHFQIVKFLVERGADVNLSVEAQSQRGKELRSPLKGAKTSEIREFLINHGARS